MKLFRFLREETSGKVNNESKPEKEGLNTRADIDREIAKKMKIKINKDYLDRDLFRVRNSIEESRDRGCLNTRVRIQELSKNGVIDAFTKDGYVCKEIPDISNSCRFIPPAILIFVSWE